MQKISNQLEDDILFIDGPSLFAPISEWQAYQKRLKKLNPNSRTVVCEKQRAIRIIALLKEEELLDESTPPPP